MMQKMIRIQVIHWLLRYHENDLYLGYDSILRLYPESVEEADCHRHCHDDSRCLLTSFLIVTNFIENLITPETNHQIAS
jgi:hypothetical protein